jgi:hypothetical protein
MPKRAKNLLLDADALTRGEEYCWRHETTLSRLVSDFLLALPAEEAGPTVWPVSPVVQQLCRTVGTPPAGERYRDYLFKERERLTKRFEDDAYLED